MLTRRSLTNILENYAQVVESKDRKLGRKKKTQVWPRYHQLDVARRLLADVGTRGVGQRYLIQHSAWQRQKQFHCLASASTDRAGKGRYPGLGFDHCSYRPADSRQTDSRHHQTVRSGRRDTRACRAFWQLATVHRVRKKIIISTVQKFPFILDEIGNEQRGRRFAIIIDEAHSSQGGRTSAAMAQALSQAGEEGEDETYEDQINRLMESRKLLPNASYFAFTATPKTRLWKYSATRTPRLKARSSITPFTPTL